MEHDYFDFDVTAGYYDEAPPPPPPPPPPPQSTHTRRIPAANRSPLTPGHDPGFLDGLLPSYDPVDPNDSPFELSSSHFEDAYPPSPSPPRRNFLDSILNPAGYDHDRYSPFPYRSTPPFLRQQQTAFDDMPPNTRARLDGSSRPARLPNGYVDLTATPDSPPQRRKRTTSTPGPSAKRRKREDGTAAKTESRESMKFEEVDLTDEKTIVQEVLQKQREDAVKSQTKPEEKPTTFNTFTCVICMDNPTDLTATACGHLFCHTCLMEALIAGENRAGHGEPKRSQCPVCRKFINRSKATDIIPLLLKKALATQPRKKKVVSPVAVVPKV